MYIYLYGSVAFFLRLPAHGPLLDTSSFSLCAVLSSPIAVYVLHLAMPIWSHCYSLGSLQKGTHMYRQDRVLVIEDDNNIRTMLELMLTRAGYEVLCAPDALKGLREAYRARPDAIILDIMLPDMDGFEACQRLREMTDTPILFLTGAATATGDIVKGLQLGADEYMTKPFSFEELGARLSVCLRQHREVDAADVDCLCPHPSVYLDCERHELVLDGQVCYLPPKEFEVLRLLVRHANRVLSQDAILAHVWGPERIGELALVKQYIYQLRKKIEPDSRVPTYIHSVRGGGYYFAVPTSIG